MHKRKNVKALHLQLFNKIYSNFNFYKITLLLITDSINKYFNDNIAYKIVRRRTVLFSLF